MTERKNLTHKQPYFDDDEDEEDMKLLEKLRKTTAWDDFLQAIYDVRLAAPVIAILSIFLAYHLTIAPYRVNVDKTAQLNMNLVNLIAFILHHDLIINYRQMYGP
jgi:hypothetical protein